MLLAMRSMATVSFCEAGGGRYSARMGARAKTATACCDWTPEFSPCALIGFT
jgi:hypothetical protein